MDAMSVRDQMIDFELHKQTVAQASRYHLGEPGVRQTIRGFGRAMVRIGEALITAGRKLERYKAPQARAAVRHGQAS
jgi:hypothetical protein